MTALLVVFPLLLPWIALIAYGVRACWLRRSGRRAQRIALNEAQRLLARLSEGYPYE